MNIKLSELAQISDLQISIVIEMVTQPSSYQQTSDDVDRRVLEGVIERNGENSSIDIQ